VSDNANGGAVDDSAKGGATGDSAKGGATGDSALIVDDDRLIALAMTMTLEDFGFTICGIAATAAEAVALATEHRPSVVLMDVRLKGARDGIEAAAEIRRLLGTPIIFVTGSGDPLTMQRMRQFKDAVILSKPMMPSDLRAAIDKVLPSRKG
jgi:CheY-like chemotaxis protein